MRKLLKEDPRPKNHKNKKSKFGRRSTEDNEDMLSTDEIPEFKRASFKIEQITILVDCATGAVIFPNEFKYMAYDESALQEKR